MFIRNLCVQDTYNSYNFLLIELSYSHLIQNSAVFRHWLPNMWTNYAHRFNEQFHFTPSDVILKCECRRESLINKPVDCGKVELRTDARIMAEA